MALFYYKARLTQYSCVSEMNMPFQSDFLGSPAIKFQKKTGQYSDLVSLQMLSLIGISMPDTEVHVVDSEGNIHDSDEVRELSIRDSYVLRGYRDDPEGAVKALSTGFFPSEKARYSPDPFGIYKTAFFTFRGRKNEFIKVRGERI
jgi:acyl-CoA synthetase (AMP-forming)/AMP-acid ligase II